MMTIQGSYTGVDNLEAMAEAQNYNRFLVHEVLFHGRDARRALDFGAGTGTFARSLREHGLNVSCVEPDQSLRDELRRHGFESHAGLDSVASASVDFIFSLNVLEHIEDHEATVRDLYQRLRPGGRLYLYLPAFNLLFSSMDRKVGHYRRYRIGPLVKLLLRSGFTISNARYADSLGFFVTLLYRFIGNDRGDLSPRALRLYDRVIFPVSCLLDRVLGRFLGKNVAVTAIRPVSAAMATPKPVAPSTPAKRAA
jgi:SAM-dependent methyltransferase